MAKKETAGDGAKPSSSSSGSPNQLIFKGTMMAIALYAIFYIGYWAYKIRMQAIEEYGLVIHEFDPYFNYRATEYLYEHGAKAFFQWFDYMVWYPLGRPVGSTIYPGMQFTAVWIKRYILGNMSVNDVCCLIPAWFGTIATMFVGLIAYECAMPANSSSNLFRFVMDIINNKQTMEKGSARPLLFGFTTPALECAICSMGMMAVVPAHLMRSVGGGYDNESIAMTAMNATFFCWIRALRRGDDYSWLWGIPAGIAYFYMVAAWGGYIFVLNMVGVHAVVLVALGRFSDKVWKAYSLFYVIGTALAIQIPVVGWAPLKSLEQLGPCAVFFGYQILQICEYIKKKRKLDRTQVWKLRVQVSLVAVGVAVAVAALVLPRGYLGPLSSRVRGLFVPHTKTGNPLVDSVAEHQAASSQAYFQYLHHVCTLAPIGYIMVMFNLSESSSFLVAWGTATYFFSHKMVRLILLTAPVGSVLGGIAAGRIFAWCLRQLWEGAGEVEEPPAAAPAAATVNGNGTTATKNGDAAAPKGKKKKKKNNAAAQKSSTSSFDGFKVLLEAFETANKSTEGIIVKRTLSVIILIIFWMLGTNFKSYCWRLSADLSHPSIIMKARTRDGRIVKVDDYREAYWWLRDNTPEDARIMAWWDYGYQITAIANRTTLADGNTWNHEHIALLGKALTTDLEEGWEIARNLADYMLVWAGGGGDDLAKSPHLARIANSVYRDHCPDDPTCGQFGFIDRQGTPSPMMERSLLYQLHGHRVKPSVEVSEDRFVEVFRSKYSKVRVYKISGVVQESKEWVKDPANRLCDVPGSWFCPGQYPPGVQKILAQKKDFAQLEDFNRADSDDEYQKQYFENLNKPKANSYHANINHANSKQQQRPQQQQKAKRVEIGSDGSIVKDERSEAERSGKQRPLPSKEELDKIRGSWADTDTTTALWSLVNEGKVDSLRLWLKEEPQVAYVRSSDGRGPMFWAYEARNTEITKLLMSYGVPTTDRDKNGKTPEDLVST
mmetsp:Transcript_36096/g.53808  ORF Transcript_36096/g.53808 Transcript_36096/m.53808 type:complete len:1001 (-) Transcript_36096:40-3042(-)|eukprot:CAMPEP_0194026132 /NCGR_PEP_ID=MMETSP0009_2-20130614/452_1 /TAXON_ID=210454 /ORGANISM="Grammatophora oceanica, Strain CCMP 410" /LENGTH=1000 /DNA_ID=CAMNT_0038664677 /DNA_START=85 /DNA_END=3087 /DNA_ORIENTATION=-